MATSVDVNVKLVSVVGATRTVGAFPSGLPAIITTSTLNGGTDTVVINDIPLLSINTFTTFVGYANIRTPKQDVFLTNIGNAALTITNTRFSLRGTSYPIFYWTPSVLLYNTVTQTSSTITILPGTTATFQLGYLSREVGEHSNFITFISNSISGDYTVNTLQSILPDADNFDISTSTFISTTTVLGQIASKGIDLIPTVNGAINTSYPLLSFTTSIVGDPGFSVASTGSNSLVLTFDPDYVGNVNNITTGYVSTLTITIASGQTRTVTNTAYVNIDYTRYRNLSTWISPAASYNSLIGISFDIFDGVKTLTIGVGAGGDGTPIYADGGSAFAVLRNLAIGSTTIEVPCPYWSTAYQIPLPSAGTYLSGQLGENGLPLYVVKTTDALNYADYFGYEQSVGSMFVVTYDGYGTVNVEINNLRELSGDVAFDATMENLTRAFHYYSNMDYPTRYYQLETPAPADPRTQLFRGFVATELTPTETWIVNTSLVPYPT